MEEILDLQEVKISQSISDNNLFNYIIDKRNLNEIDYQKDVCCNPLYKNSTNPVAFLQSECSGKTEEMLSLLEMFYFRDKNKGLKTILNPSALKVTRDNIEDRFTDFQPEFFKFKVAKNSKEYLDLLNKQDEWDVLIITPQLLNTKDEKDGVYNYELLPEIEIYICDEGSDWYFEKVIQRMLKHINPNIQWIFAAQSGKFNLHKDRFTRVFTSTSTLYDKGIISNVKFNVVTTNVDLKASDFTSTKNIGYGNLKEEFTNDKKTNITSFREMFSEMVKILKIENSDFINIGTTANRLTNNYAHVFGKLEQTLIVCNSKEQATNFYDELNTDINLNGKILISTEDTDNDSIYLKDFKEGNHRILIVVYKGRKGYSHNELFNIVDFTYTQDPEMIKNISGRVYRKSKIKPNKQKTYFKVAYKTAAPWYVTIMTGVLALMEDGPYQTYNTKNFDGFKIPIVLTTQETNKKSKGKGKKRNSNPDFTPVSKMGLPLDMNFFNNVAHHKLNDAYSVIAYTTIGELRRNHFEMLEKWSPEKVEQIYSKYKNKSLRELTTNEPMAYRGGFRYGIHVSLMEKYNITQQFEYKTHEDLLNYINGCENFLNLYEDRLIWRRIIKLQYDLEKNYHKVIINKFGIENVEFKFLTDDEKLEVCKLQITKYKTLTEFAKKSPTHYNYLIRRFKPSKSEEGRIEYDKIILSLEIKKKGIIDYNNVVICAKNELNFKTFIKNHSDYYDFLVNSRKITDFRLEMEDEIPGWDNGLHKPKGKRLTKEDKVNIQIKYESYVNNGLSISDAKKQTSKDFKISLYSVRSIVVDKENVIKSYQEHKDFVKPFNFSSNKGYMKLELPEGYIKHVEPYFKKTKEWEGWPVFLGKKSNVTDEDIINLWEKEGVKERNGDGKSYEQIANELDVPKTYVGKLIRKYKK